MVLRSRKLLVAVVILTGSMLAFTLVNKHRPVDYSAEVKPILNKSCISCHGGVKQKGGFSLLFREEAMAKTESGKPAIIPGDPDNSEFMKRVTHSDPEERMPYKHDPLTEAEINVLRRWIKEGAVWGEHWAYVPVKETPIPQLKTFFGWVGAKSEWAVDPIDNFIEQKLNEQGLNPSPEADKQTLLRRTALDIIGMPAPESIATKFMHDRSDQAYEHFVDSLLASPHYGEKWAALWLDLARYADTKGYERDDSRNIWKYRDWLIRSFNEDKPYDRFLTEQIAGDLLPEATDDQYIATAFHRNTMTNDEGGTDNEEFRTSAVLDRVNATWDAVMGTTFACVQCHSHPYDPFRHDDYYKFMAFFNDTRDEDSYADYPLLRSYNDSLKIQLSNVVDWMKQNSTPLKAKEIGTFLKTWQPAYNSLVCDSFTNSELNDTKWLAFRNNAICRLKNVTLDKKDRLLFRYTGLVGGGTWKIHIDSADGEVIATIPLPKTEKSKTAPFEDGVAVAWKITETPLKSTDGVHDLYFTYYNSHLKKADDNGAYFDWFYFTEKLPGEQKPGYAEIKKDYWNLLSADALTTPVMMDNPSDMHRPSHVFERGNWLVKGDKVTPDVPKSLNPFPANAPRNRYGLAMWLTSKQNPLTARTMVNRVWEQLFGTGLAETLEDLGSQGIPPTHLELLNALSYRFMYEYNWSVKKLIRQIILSATYRQDSKISQELLRKDPYNKFYARGARVRLSSEQVRDQALCISGLMSSKMYGPSVFPWQPAGIWLTPYNGAQWQKSSGEDQYRRAVYTYWKRTAPYPSMITFDGVAREVSTPRRIRTNTPLQALTALNDSAFIDIARHFALRMKNEAGADVQLQIKAGFEMATHRSIEAKSLQSLVNLYNSVLTDNKNAEEKIHHKTGGAKSQSNPEATALTVVANAILNLDEVVMKN